jgi:hypothetical protein
MPLLGRSANEYFDFCRQQLRNTSNVFTQRTLTTHWNWWPHNGGVAVYTFGEVRG